MVNRFPAVVLLLMPGLLGPGLAAWQRAADQSRPRQATGAATTSAKVTVGFDDLPAGRLSEAWTPAATGEGELAWWVILADESAPSAPNVLAMTVSPHARDQTFNLCLNQSLRFRDGRLSVKLKADKGEVDQGGGPVWRARDEKNYYICRANPLESNFRVYKVVNGTRKQLAGASVDVPSGTWLSIEVEHIGNRIVCTLNGTTRIEATDDELQDEGAVGLWTKADALTRFDDLVIEPARPAPAAKP